MPRAIFVVLPWLPPILQFAPVYRVRTTKCHIHQGDLDNPYVYYYVFTYPRRIKPNLVTLKGQGQRPSQFQGRFVYTTAQFDVIDLFRFVAIALAFIDLIHFVTFILILIGLVITVIIILVTLLVHISVK